MPEPLDCHLPPGYHFATGATSRGTKRCRLPRRRQGWRWQSRRGGEEGRKPVPRAESAGQHPKPPRSHSSRSLPARWLGIMLAAKPPAGDGSGVCEVASGEKERWWWAGGVLQCLLLFLLLGRVPTSSGPVIFTQPEPRFCGRAKPPAFLTGNYDGEIIGIFHLP